MSFRACFSVCSSDPMSAYPLSCGADEFPAQRVLLRFEHQRRVRSDIRQSAFKDLHNVRPLSRTCLLLPAHHTASDRFIYSCQFGKLTQHTSERRGSYYVMVRSTPLSATILRGPPLTSPYWVALAAYVGGFLCLYLLLCPDLPTASPESSRIEGNDGRGGEGYREPENCSMALQ